MSHANFPAIHGPYRRKVTLACGSCRKRRVKCSGSQPCTLCSESGRRCEFDNNNRGRRGPKPRQPAAAQRVLHPIAPNRSPLREAPSTRADARIDQAWNPQQLPVVEDEIHVVQDNCGVDGGSEDEDNDSSADEESSCDPSLWRPGLEDLFYRNNSILSVVPSLDVHLMCHLLEMFCARSSAQLRPILSPSQVQKHLSRGSAAGSLVLAACASGVRFTVHKSVTGSQRQRIAEAMEKAARKRVILSRDGWAGVCTIKCLCVLSDYAASRGNGRQAWTDIAMGMALAQLAKLDRDLEAEQIEELAAAEKYLAVAQLTHRLGHPALLPLCDGPPDIPGPETQCILVSEPSPHLKLLGILVRAYYLWSKPFTEQNPLPWGPRSRFRLLQDELEEHLLRHPDTFRFVLSTPREDSKEEDLERSVTSLIWHCCVIILNRTFLPIPERTPGEGKGESSVRCVDFPGAPPLFLKERIHRCESSADAIFGISRDIIRGGGFYSHAVLVGFACTNAALVSINRLHRSSQPYDERLLETVKISLVVLGALKTFHSPAKEWMNLLLRVHDTHSAPMDTAKPVEEIFNGYFSRFTDIQEPAFVPLDPGDSDSLNDVSRDTAPTEKAERPGENNLGNNEQSEEKPPDGKSEWLQAYAGHLSEDIGTGAAPSVRSEREGSGGVPIAPARTEAMAEGVPGFAVEGDSAQKVDAEMGTVESPVHMAGAILTAMAGGTPTQAQTQQTPSQLVHGGDLRPEGFGDVFSALLDQMPSFADVTGLDVDMAMFPELEPVIGGSDNVWSDVFNFEALR